MATMTSVGSARFRPPSRCRRRSRARPPASPAARRPGERSRDPHEPDMGMRAPCRQCKSLSGWLASRAGTGRMAPWPPPSRIAMTTPTIAAIRPKLQAVADRRAEPVRAQAATRWIGRSAAAPAASATTRSRVCPPVVPAGDDAVAPLHHRNLVARQSENPDRLGLVAQHRGAGAPRRRLYGLRHRAAPAARRSRHNGAISRPACRQFNYWVGVVVFAAADRGDGCADRARHAARRMGRRRHHRRDSSWCSPISSASISAATGRAAIVPTPSRRRSCRAKDGFSGVPRERSRRRSARHGRRPSRGSRCARRTDASSSRSGRP